MAVGRGHEENLGPPLGPWGTHPHLARRFHPLTLVVAVVAHLLPLALGARGTVILTEQEPPRLAARLGRVFSCLTIRRTLLVAAGGGWWRLVRAAAVVGITVTGAVHLLLLRPLPEVNRLADSLQLTVPLLAVVGWLVLGPRPRVTWARIDEATLWPVL